MTEKFNPAPRDKHATHPKEAVKADKAMHNELQKGLKDSFPASDPASATQPSHRSTTGTPNKRLLRW